MKNIFASTALLAALAAGMSPAFAQQGTPSKDDIINALSSDPSAAGTPWLRLPSNDDSAESESRRKDKLS